MTRSRLSLRRLVRPVRSNRSFLFLALSLLFAGCSSSTSPTYLGVDIPAAIQDISKKEYNTEVKAKLIGHTLWVYLPVEDMFLPGDGKDKFPERFSVDYAQGEFKGEDFRMEYLVRPLPETMKPSGIKYNKGVLEKVSNAWKVLRRVIFSTDYRKKDAPLFFCMITSDIKKGYEVQELFYYLDLKKVYYEFISWDEYQHRSIQDIVTSPLIIGDRRGAHITYRDISMKEFLSRQIAHRIKLKFQKPEVEKNADIDREIYKIIAHTMNIYNFKDFSAVELNNLMTRDKAVLKKADVLTSGAK